MPLFDRQDDDAPLTLVAIQFGDPFRAQEFLSAATRLAANGHLTLKDALFGLLLAGPIGWVGGLALGAGTGAVTAKLVDLGIPDEWVDWFRKAVQPGTVILALLVTHLYENALVTETERFS